MSSFGELGGFEARAELKPFDPAFIAQTPYNSSGTVAVANQSDPPPAITPPPPPSYSEQPPQPQRTLPPPPAPQYGPGPIAMSLRAYRPPRYTPHDGDQVAPFDQRRRLIAEHMVYSKARSPHVPCTAEVDRIALSRRREEWKRAWASCAWARSSSARWCGRSMGGTRS